MALYANPADLGLLNRRRVLAFVAQQGTATRSSLAGDVGLTRPAISRIVADLVNSGLLVKSEPQMGAALGRPATALQLPKDRHLFVGVDLRLDGVLIQSRDLAGQLLSESRHSLGTGATPEHAVDLIEAAVRESSERIGRDIDGIGLSVGASQGEAGTIVTGSPYRPWRRVPLPQMVADRFPNNPPPIRMADVSGSAALANWMELCTDLHLDDLVHLQVGIGAGSGWVRRSQGFPQLVKPARIAHLPLLAGGRSCVCGSRGCFDAMAGFWALVDAARGTGLRPVEGPRMIEVYCAELADRAVGGDRVAVRAIEEMAMWIAHGAIILINVTRPSRFTYGGYPMLLGPVFQSCFTETLAARVPDLATVLSTTPLGDRASAMGTHWLATSWLMTDALTRPAQARPADQG